VAAQESSTLRSLTLSLGMKAVKPEAGQALGAAIEVGTSDGKCTCGQSQRENARRAQASNTLKLLQFKATDRAMGPEVTKSILDGVAVHNCPAAAAAVARGHARRRLQSSVLVLLTMENVPVGDHSEQLENLIAVRRARCSAAGRHACARAQKSRTIKWMDFNGETRLGADGARAIGRGLQRRAAAVRCRSASATPRHWRAQFRTVCLPACSRDWLCSRACP
jgi:hypothetical protein